MKDIFLPEASPDLFSRRRKDTGFRVGPPTKLGSIFVVYNFFGDHIYRPLTGRYLHTLSVAYATRSTPFLTCPALLTHAVGRNVGNV